VSREVPATPKTLDDLRYMVEHNTLPADVRAEIDDEDLQKLIRGEKVKIKGFGKANASDDGEDEDPYDKMDKKELTAELASRVDSEGQPLSTSGTNAEMAQRLRDHDEANA
jgi:hypothetical protein